MDSPSVREKEMMSLESLTVFPGGKYLCKNSFERSSYIVNELAFGFKNQDLSLSFNEKGNGLK